MIMRRIDSLAVPGAARLQRGFTMVELMVAITLGVFLLGGVLTLVQTTRNAAGTQTALAQLQDNERLAMTMVTDVLQAAGYYPSPTVNTSSVLPATAPFVVAGQGLTGVSAAGPGGDTVTARYMTTGQDGILNCIGTSNNNALGVTVIYVNAFSVDGNGNLLCTLNNNAPVTLVTGVQSMTILYGTETLTSNCVDSYLTAAQVAAGHYWTAVCSIQITITFINPAYKAGNPAQPQFIPFQRVIGVMAKTGVNT